MPRLEIMEVTVEQEQSNQLVVPKALTDLPVPRCAVCEECEGNDIQEDGGTFEKVELISLPQCRCEVFLVVPQSANELMKCLSSLNADNELKTVVDTIEFTNEIPRLNKALASVKAKKCKCQIICRKCFEGIMRSSNDVISHDYRGKAANNPKFSVTSKCPVCSVKFSSRTMEKLLATFGSSDASKSWKESIVLTVKIIKFIQSNRKEAAEPVKPPLLTTLPGELKQDLLAKDPIFRQEVEDYRLVREKIKTAGMLQKS